MMEGWRELLYPLGFLSGLAFTLRFLVQWLQSEKAQKSLVNPSFWKISLIGNILLFIHSFIQIQFHVCVVQACNAVISWRNLNLMGPEKKQCRLLIVMALLAAAILLSTLFFILQGLGIDDTHAEWFRTPVLPWGKKVVEVHWSWHIVGSLGIILFNSRFWIQWWEAETSRRSVLSATFWWLSIVGAMLSLIYFAMLGDLVNFIGPLFGLVPYVRNLMLIRKVKKRLATADFSA